MSTASNTPEPPLSAAERAAQRAAKHSASRAAYDSKRIALEQQLTRANVEHTRELATIDAEYEAENARMRMLLIDRHIDQTRTELDRLTRANYGIVEALAMGRSYAVRHEQARRLLGYELSDTPLVVAVAEEHFKLDPAAREALACSGAFQETFHRTGIGHDAAAAKRALLGTDPVAIRDALAKLASSVATVGARTAPRMPREHAEKRWAIIRQTLPAAAEAAAIREHDAEIAAPRHAAREAEQALIRRARGGDADAIEELRAAPAHVVSLAVRGSEALLGAVSAGFRKAFGRHTPEAGAADTRSASGNAHLMGA